MAAWRTALRIHDPGLALLRSAARVAIVIPAVFALADKVIANPQLSLFAAFGSFAMLALVEFGGPVRGRLIAYPALACVGGANIALGTLCSRDPALAAAAMALIGFAILFSGIVNVYFATASGAALLTFILAAMVPEPASAIPARLEGWALAAGAATAGQLLIWPLRVQASLRTAAARAATTLADLTATELARDPATIADQVRNAGGALRRLRAEFLAAPHKPSGPTGPQAALNSLVDELDWTFAVLAPPAQPPTVGVCPNENANAVAAVVDALRATAATLEGRDERPDFDRLRETRQALARALAHNIIDRRAFRRADHRGLRVCLPRPSALRRERAGRPVRASRNRSRRRRVR
jgi:hypothetical protein